MISYKDVVGTNPIHSEEHEKIQQAEAQQALHQKAEEVQEKQWKQLPNTIKLRSVLEFQYNETLSYCIDNSINPTVTDFDIRYKLCELRSLKNNFKFFMLDNTQIRIWKSDSVLLREKDGTFSMNNGLYEAYFGEVILENGVRLKFESKHFKKSDPTLKDTFYCRIKNFLSSSKNYDTTKIIRLN